MHASVIWEKPDNGARNVAVQVLARRYVETLPLDMGVYIQQWGK